MEDRFQPVLELTRGRIVESVHYGAAAVVDSNGRLLASLGDPKLVTFLRSSAKPLQVLPFIERGGDQAFHLTSREIAILCASHDGTDEQVDVIRGIMARVGVQESDLLCGSHPVSHVPTAEALRARGEAPTPLRHNCSGKHTGMLAAARMRGLPISAYLDPDHPVQRSILSCLAEMCRVPEAQVEVGIDGCSAPNFAVSLYQAAVGFARLVDPHALAPERAAACRRITQSMMANPGMVAGPGRFDTCLMEACPGRIVSKGGAEGYLLMAIPPGSPGATSRGLGIALKIADGDLSIRKTSGETYNRARPAVALEILRQLGCIDQKELETLAAFGPVKPVINWRKLVVGEARPCFDLMHGNGTQ